MNIDITNKLIVAISVLFVVSCGGSTVTDTAPGAGFEIGAALSENVDRYTVLLSGSQVLPAVDTRYTGQADFTVDEQTGQLYGTVVTSVENVTAVHLHEGGVGEVGGVVVSLIASATGAGNSTFNVPANFILTQQQRQSYSFGRLYVDIHAGDVVLRGQLSAEPPALAIGAELDDLQAKVFTPLCSGCHFGSGNNLPAIMDLTNADASYSNLVGVYSIGESDLLRVSPGDAEDSLLVRKLEGTQAVGVRMPFRGAKLDADTIAAVRQWINSGAGR